MRPKKTILCIDDNEQLLSIRKFMLETRGYNVIACTNGRDAMKAFNGGNVDLVLCDLLMPEVDGAEVVRQVKAISPGTPAIIFSGKLKIYDKDMNADVFLPKGMLAPTELLERIRLLLIRKRGPKKATPLMGAAVSTATPAATRGAVPISAAG